MVTPSHPTTHGGVERIIESASATRSVLSEIFSAKRLPTYVLGVTIMAVVTATERALDAVSTGFALEWAILSAVALLTFGLLAGVILRGTKASQGWLATRAAAARAERADRTLWNTALRDPRVMNDILVAQGRADALRDEAAPAMRTSMSVRDDGLAALAPWPQATRYY